MSTEIWKMQDRCKGLAAQVVMSANKIYGEIGAATLDQGSLFEWRHIYVQLEGLADVLADLENNLTTITGGK
jgi:hypothetical protein